jgi:CheY-like chemotaxis protein
LKQIRQRHPDLAIVVVTGRAAPMGLDEVPRRGVTDVVAKPRVLERLDEALGPPGGRRRQLTRLISVARGAFPSPRAQRQHRLRRRYGQTCAR